MSKVIIYAKDSCPFCVRARELLRRKGINFQEFDIANDAQLKEEMITRSNRHTVPQIFINDVHIGGFDDLHALDCQGELDKILKG